MSSLNKLWVLLLEDSEVPFGFPGEDAVGGEDQVHLFEGPLVGFGVQAVYHGQGDDVGDTEDVVSLLSESFEHWGQDECEPAIANGPSDHTPSVAFGSDLQGEDLGWVEPWDGEPGGAECCCEEEDHGHGAGAVASSGSGARRMSETERCETTCQEHRDALDDGAPVQGPSTTDSVKSEDADECGQHVCDCIQTRDPLDVRFTDTSGPEDGRGKDSDSSNSDPFLHDLDNVSTGSADRNVRYL